MRQTTIAVLRALFDVYPSDLGETDVVFNKIRQRASTMPADEEPLDGASILSEALQDLRRGGYIRRGARERLAITADGIEWLASHQQGISYGEILGSAGAMIRYVAKLARANEAVEERQVQIDDATKRLDQHQKEIERRIIDADREVFRRVIPFFALFAAAFALINASSQAAIRTSTPTVPGASPADTFWANLAQAGGVIAPVGLVIVILLVGAWLLVRLIP